MNLLHPTLLFHSDFPGRLTVYFKCLRYKNSMVGMTIHLLNTIRSNFGSEIFVLKVHNLVHFSFITSIIPPTCTGFACQLTSLTSQRNKGKEERNIDCNSAEEERLGMQQRH